MPQNPGLPWWIRAQGAVAAALAPPPFYGRGAWTATGKNNGERYYRWLQRHDNNKDGDSPLRDVNYQAVHLGVLAIQRRIKDAGYTGPLTANGRFGSQTRNAVMWFQAQNGLVDDGICGPASAKQLWRPLIEYLSGGPDWAPADHLWGMMYLESAFDPGAVGWTTPSDRGLCQINLVAHPAISVEQAFDPTFAINYSAGRLAAGRAQFDGKGPELQRDCSIAQHNSPLAAKQWYAAGYPPNPKIAAYVALVLKYADSY